MQISIGKKMVNDGKKAGIFRLFAVYRQSVVVFESVVKELVEFF